MDDFDKEAELLAWSMHNDLGLSLLGKAEKAYLSDQLRDLLPEGTTENEFRTQHKHPPREKVNQDLLRLWKGLRAVMTVARRDNSISEAAIIALLDAMYDKAGENAARDMEHLLTAAAGLNDALPKEPVFAEPHPEIEVQTTRMEYKTYVIGSVLPYLFNNLYPGTPIGVQDTATEFRGPGVHFILDCCAVIGMKDVSAESIRKAIERVRKSGLEQQEASF